MNHPEAMPIEDEISLKELIQKLQSVWQYLLKNWLKIFIAGVIGGSVGFIYAYFQPIKYTSKLSFVLEDSKSGGGGLASLAGQFGFDIGGAGGGSIFSEDNILLFLKSEGLVRETLMTNYKDSSKNTLADQYAVSTGLKEGWQKNEKVGAINFGDYNQGELPRIVDSLMQLIVTGIINNELSVSRPDKKASFIEVKMTSNDERFSQLFVERLVKVATDRYVESKIKTKALNVSKLQQKADSLGALLNNKTYVAAATQQNLVDANPALRTAPIASEISSREKTMAATIFAEVIKNLELSKTILNQETPVIQIVDQSTLPLVKEKVGKRKSIIFGGVLSGFLMAAFLLASRWIKSIIS